MNSQTAFAPPMSINQSSRPPQVFHTKTGSKPFRMEYFGLKPTHFKIYYKRTHQYADGIQIIELRTNEILDTFGERISDGTFVNFNINTSTGSFIKATTRTIDGIARVNVPAPSIPSIWSISGEVPFFAVSEKPIEMVFYPSVTDFPFTYRQNLSQIQVGPVVNRLGNLLKDGTPVTISFENKCETESCYVLLKDGAALINLRELNLSRKRYITKVELLGIQKRFDNIILRQ